MTEGAVIRETVYMLCDPCGKYRTFLPGVVEGLNETRPSDECDHSLITQVHVWTSARESTRMDLNH